jgi:hypothetical protein
MAPFSSKFTLDYTSGSTLTPAVDVENKRKSVLNVRNFAKHYCINFDSQITDENASKATNAVGITDTTP